MKNTQQNPHGIHDAYKEIAISNDTKISGNFDAKTNGLILGNPYQIFQGNNITYSGCLRADSEGLKFHGQGCYYLNNLTFQGKFINNKPDAKSQFNVNSTTDNGFLIYQGSINCFFQQHGFGTLFSQSGSNIFSASGIFCNGDYLPNLQYDIKKNGLLIYRGQIKVENLKTAILNHSLKSNADKVEKGDSVFLFHGEGAFYKDQKIFKGRFVDGIPDREVIFEIECCDSKLKYNSKLTNNFELTIPNQEFLATHPQDNSQEEEELKWQKCKEKLADGTFAFKGDSLMIVNKDSKINNFINPKSSANIATNKQINKIL